MKKTKAVIQEEAMNAWWPIKKGCVVMTPGTGKTKLGLDISQRLSVKTLVTVPRVNLVKEWGKEMEKWGITVDVMVINSAYKKDLSQYDFLIFDEVHTISESFYQITKQFVNKPILGLTGTPNKFLDFKQNVLYKELPIVYEYLESSKDKLINETKIYMHPFELTDAKIPFKIFNYDTERSAYNVVDRYVKKTYAEIKAKFPETPIDSCKVEDKQLFSKYMFYVYKRRRILCNLTTSVDMAKKIAEVCKDKCLVFSESIEQASRICEYTVSYKTNKNNATDILAKFNMGEIKTLGSVNTLTLGLNLNGASFAVFESFNGSDTNVKQKLGRLSRLNIDEIANAIFLVPVDTQAEKWFDRLELDYTIVTDFNELLEIVKQ